MTTQMYINAALGLAAFLGGWVMRMLWTSLRDLQKADKNLLDRVGAIEVLVAGEYVKNDKFDRFADKVFEKLDNLADKITQKADR